jgi:hypothetical protein
MESEQEATETLTYAFDFPLVTESGSVRISDSQIVLQFPEKPSTYVKSIKIPQNINVFIENDLRFSLEWIPIHTWSDYMRTRDMLEKTLQSYQFLTEDDAPFSPHTYSWNPIRWPTSTTTSLTKPGSFSLDCFVNSYDTCLQLCLLNTENNEKETPLHFQLCIGKNIVFCTQRDLHSVPFAGHVHFIVKFILYKLLNY